MEFDDLSNRAIGCAVEVHREPALGLPDSTYEQCLAHELELNGASFQLQHPQPVLYQGLRLDWGRSLTYMTLAGVKTGLPINLNVTELKDGIERFVF